VSPTTIFADYADYEGNESVAVMIGRALGVFVDHFDIEGIEREYRARLDDALPPNVTLAGNQFLANYPAPPGTGEAIATAIESVDFWGIVESHQVR
jgi:hypothetical protein